MSDPWVVAVVTIGLIGASAFFVAVEFALIAARRHRLEDAAATSPAARAALRSSSELSVLLAGSQLGITVCTLALGAITKPAVHHWLTPLFERIGAPVWVADVAGFVLALVIVTFLHLVVGEMAPKSWAIAHPERSATMLAIPMRAFMAVTRPLLKLLNQMANWCLRRVGVTPVDEVESGQDPAALRHLVEHSATAGTLDERYHGNLISALELEQLTVGDLMRPDASPDAVTPGADRDAIQAVSRATGHLRMLVRDADGTRGVVHVRDSLTAAPDATAADMMRPVLTLTATTPIYEALRTMRETRSHLAVVTDAEAPVGLITITDVLRRLLPTAAGKADQRVV
ncbi:HlyC/CorC family transporter [Nocardia cyriacigeorgica]|uniref:HlyC/CorC family transporter n=1 Tax=Nocardia cyriacigeorgica TaxID=135487 RepID=A0A6P1D5B8_9NOCA|nr:hemolysin family protein [Nocardia cyriacigeorgica]NEW38158.1 HlyC/CorC family transporter [Nocardia cyriacigeorgica]NEW45816.1 HlyC/CorC family transporter [Nocardia cyriacigeorgica]NEW48459.1 HlyC/CorC family transporter [Nocardia cyriacigeorgica]NEW57553.1 HlyC/CorC family transporter [Nocardia cyriacigeorgica]